MSGREHFRAADRVRGMGSAALALAFLACLILFAMMLAVFVDVVGRGVFGRPLPAAYELVSLCMPGIIFCALPLTVLREGHVTVDLLDEIIPRGIARVQGILVSLLSAGALGMVAWRLAVRSQDQIDYNEVTDALFLPLWPFSAGMAVLCALAALAAVANAWRHATGRMGR